MGGLNEAEALVGFGDRFYKLVPELVRVVILGQVELVEAGVSRGKSVASIRFMNGELLRAPHANQGFESFEGHLSGPGHKLEEPGELFLGELFVKKLPQPLNLRR